MSRNSSCLTLYVAGSRHAPVVEQLRDLVEQSLDGRVRLEVVDVRRNPEAAEEANILATPTLVFAAGRTSRRIIGDFSDTEMLMNWLRSNDRFRI